jgi:hypothetical protein
MHRLVMDSQCRGGLVPGDCQGRHPQLVVVTEDDVLDYDRLALHHDAVPELGPGEEVWRITFRSRPTAGASATRSSRLV